MVASFGDLYHFLAFPIGLLQQYLSLTMNALVVCTLSAFLLLTLGDRSRLRARVGDFSKWIGIGAAIVSVGALVLSTVAYTRAPGVKDHCEVSVISISALWGQHKPLYLGLDAAERYSIPYGPAAYLCNSAVMSLYGSGIRVVKAVGAGLLLLSFMAMAVCARRLGCSRGSVVLVLGYIAAGIALLEAASLGSPIASWARPDPHLLFWVSFCALCTTIRHRVLAVLGIGIAIGFCINLKIHTAIYALPMLLPLFCQTGLRGLAACFVVAAIVALAPFAVLPGVSLPKYLGLFAGAAGNVAFSWGLLIELAKESGFLLLPLLVLFLANLLSSEGTEFRTCLRQQSPAILSVLLTTLIVLVPASEAHNLANHLLPLLPGYAMVLSTLLCWPRRAPVEPRWAMRGGLALAAAFVILGTSQAIVASHGIYGWSLLSPFIDRPALAEIQTVLDRSSGETSAMGYGTNDTYPWTFCRPLFAFRGQPCLVDAPVVMAGLPISQATIDALRDGYIKIWMVPRGGKPFSMRSLGPRHEPLFDERFRNAFLTNYEIRDGTAHFDIWVHRTAAVHIATAAGIDRR